LLTKKVGNNNFSNKGYQKNKQVPQVIKVNKKKVANNNFSNKGIDTIRVHVTFEDFFKKTEELQYGSHFTSASRFF
jgi:hypothetical protein